jgi:hypothetical protein
LENPDWDRRIAFADAFTGRSKPDEITQEALVFALARLIFGPPVVLGDSTEIRISWT